MASQAHCTKCGLKHVQPVGIRCNRILNQSVPIIAANSSDLVDSDDPDLPTPGQKSRNSESSTNGSNHSQAQGGPSSSSMDKKLDLILQRMEHLEKKNQQLEQKVEQNVKGKARVRHSSPKQSHRCEEVCRPKKQFSARKQQTHLTDDSSDEDNSQLTSFSPSRTGAGRSSHSAVSDQSQISLEFLKTDEKVQRKVQRQLERLQGSSRGTSISGTKTLKSGLLRSGDNAVRQEIAWPHHYCFPGPGGQLPEYKDLSPIQFFIGFLGCLQEEKSNTVRSNMIDYGRHLMQDAMETNWNTARHAHLVVLQDIERGKLSWRNPDQVDKVRIRNTARVIMAKNTPQIHKQSKTSSKDKICEDYNDNNCTHQSDHVVNGLIHKHACQYCFAQVGRFCNHKLQDCLRKKTKEARDTNSNK